MNQHSLLRPLLLFGYQILTTHGAHGRPNNFKALELTTNPDARALFL